MFSKRFGPLIIGSLLILVLDQYTKYLIRQNMGLYTSAPIIDGFFNLTHIANPGVAFGIGARVQGEWLKRLFILVSVVAVAILIAVYREVEAKEPFLKTGLIFICGGALGNLIDRFMMGEVTDFLDFYWGRHHWPAFNVADSCISIGIGIIITSWILSSFRGAHHQSASDGEK